MKKLISMILCLTLCLSATLALAQETKTITIGATPEPHASILELIKEDFEKLGYVLGIKVSQDYYYFNPVTADGDLDCNFFQHEAFLNQDYNNNAEEGKKLVNVCAVHYEPLGIYAGTKTDLTQVADGDVISVPNDGSNYTRALFLLQDAGLIKLREGVTAFDALTIDDVAEKIVNIEIKDMNADLQAIALEDVAYAVLNGNYAISAGFSVEQALLAEPVEGDGAKTYANILVVREADKDEQWVKDLSTLLNSEKVRTYIESNPDFKGGVIPMF